MLVPLRAFDEYCKKNQCNRSPKALFEFIIAYCGEKIPHAPLTADFFNQHLHQGCLLMFDGVDEVDPVDRNLVRKAVEDLVSQSENPHLYCLITSRPSAAYIPGQMAGFHRCDVQPLTNEQRNHLIQLWYFAVMPENKAEARRKADDLCRRITASAPRGSTWQKPL